jgi:NTE family protein
MLGHPRSCRRPTVTPCGLLVAACVALPAAPASSQAPPPAGAVPAAALSPPAARVRVGLALSGGAARGLAHIGVLKVLEEAGMPVDVVAGTSMGSVIGGLYAVGYNAAQLDTIVTTEDWFGVLTDVVRRRDLPVERKHSEDRYLLTLPVHRGGVHLPKSVVAGQRVSQLLTRLTWPAHAVRDFRTLPIAFTAVATDLETGAAVVLDHGFLPDVMRASMALPSVFSPVELEGRALIDGGVVRNLPAQDARALGADVLICSDVTDPLEARDSLISFIDVLVQSVSFRIWDSESAQRKQCDVLIIPDVRAFSTFGFDRVRDVIARGEAAARAALPEIEALRARASGAQRTRASAVAPESVLVETIHFDRPELVSPGLLERALCVKAPAWVSRRALDAGIDRLYATGLFESVHYRLAPSAGGAPERRELTVAVRERSAGRFGLGLRYDSRYKASVLLSRTLGGGAGLALSTQADVRLGQQIEVGLRVAQPVGRRETTTLGAGVRYGHSPFDLYAGGRRVAQARVDLGALGASIARTLGRAAVVSVRAKTEFARWNEDVSAVAAAPVERTFYSVAGVLDAETYDRGVFPSRGVRVRAVSEWGNRIVGRGSPFSHHFADVRGYLPLYRTVSLWAGATVGASGGDPLPHYQFFLGGANTYYLFPDRDVAFVGLHTQERRGRHLQKVELGAQWEFRPDVVALASWNAGNVYDRWTWDPAGYVDGASIGLGVKTFAGRLSVSVSGNAHTTWPIVELDLGHPF